jgi:hypothetical protein
MRFSANAFAPVLPKPGITAGKNESRIEKLHLAGDSKGEIARQLKIGRTSVRRILASYFPKKQGRPSSLRTFAEDSRCCEARSAKETAGCRLSPRD